jgi:hypothetical protein
VLHIFISYYFYQATTCNVVLSLSPLPQLLLHLRLLNMQVRSFNILYSRICKQQTLQSYECDPLYFSRSVRRFGEILRIQITVSILTQVKLIQNVGTPSRLPNLTAAIVNLLNCIRNPSTCPQ